MTEVEVEELEDFIVEDEGVPVLVINEELLERLGAKEAFLKDPWRFFVSIWSKVKEKMDSHVFPFVKDVEMEALSLKEATADREALEKASLLKVRATVTKKSGKEYETHPYAKIKCKCKSEDGVPIEPELLDEYKAGKVVYLVPDVGLSPNVERRNLGTLSLLVNSGCTCKRTSVFGKIMIPYVRGELMDDDGATRAEAVFVGSAAKVPTGTATAFYGFWALRALEYKSVSSLVSSLDLRSGKFEKVFVVLGYDEEERSEDEASEEKFKEWVKDPWFEEKLVESIFADYYGYYFFKKALVLAVINGVPKENFRENVHVLAITDPGVGKTTAFHSLRKVAPKAVYISGTQSTKAGLVAALELGPDGWEVVAGALVSASGGVAIIDEIDKLSKEDLEHLHEAMEEQEVHINKASVRNVTLRTKVSVVAGGNPKFSKFDPRKPVGENISLPASILSRFDLIFAIRNTFVYELFGEELGDEIISELVEFAAKARTEGKVKRWFSEREIKAFLKTAREKKVEWTEEAEKALAETFKELMLRTVKAELRNVSTAAQTNMRTLNALVRLAEANAKLHLKDKVTKEDVVEALTLMQMSHLTLGIIGLEEAAQGCIGSIEAKEELYARLVSEIVDEAVARTDKASEVLEAVKEAAEKRKEELERIGKSVEAVINEVKEMLREGKLVGTKVYVIRAGKVER